MAIRNINTIQTDLDVATLSSEYSAEALANSGQRYGIAGDSIITSSFNLKELFGHTSISNDDNKNYIYEVSLTNNEFSCVMKDRETLTTQSSYKTNVSSLSTYSDYIYINSNFVLSNKINGIEYYQGAILSIDNEFSFIFKSINAGEIVDVTIITVSKLTNKIVSAVKVTSSNTYYCKLTSEDNYDVYKVSCNLDLETCYTDLLSYVSIYNSENLDAYTILTDTAVNNFTDYCIYEGLLNNIFTISKFSTAIYDEDSTSFTCTDSSINTYLAQYQYDLIYLYRESKEYYSNVVYKTENSSLKIQVIYKLAKAICANANYTSSTTSLDSITKLYIPLDFEINYTTSKTDEWKVYYNIGSINIQYTTTSDSNISNYLINNVDDDSSSIICQTDKEERVSIFEFTVSYDSEDSTIVDGIQVTKTNTLPFINSDGYWVINDEETDVYAKGKNAGNPNIIIVQNFKYGSTSDTSTDTNPKNSTNFNILHGANRDILTSLNWKIDTAYVIPIDKANFDDLKLTTTTDYIPVNCHVPDISKWPSSYENRKDEWIELIKNSIILNICTLDCIDTDNSPLTRNELEAMYGSNGVISTFWIPDTDDNDNFTNYVCLNQFSDNDNIAAVDFNYLANINNLLNYKISNIHQVEPDKYKFTYLVFDPVQNTLKNNSTELHPTYIYPTLMSVPSDLYGQTNYGNDLNLVFKFNDTVVNKNNLDVSLDSTVDKEIFSVEQSAGNRFLNTQYNTSGNSSANLVTNSLYHYLNGTTTSNYSEFIPNYNVPSLDLGEVLTRNETLLNRLNLMIMSSTGVTYNSYIGSSVDGNKNVLTIGSSSTNINLGTDTLATESDKHKFAVQKEMHINFDNIMLSGYSYVANDNIVLHDTITYGINWTKTVRENTSGIETTYWDCDYTPKGRYLFEATNIYSGADEGEYPGVVNLNEPNTTNTWLDYLYNKDFYDDYVKDNDKLFAICRVPEDSNYKIYINDGIYIPELLHKIGLDNYMYSSDKLSFGSNNFVISSNMKVINYSQMPLLLLSTSTILYEKGKYNYSNEIANNTTSLGGNGIVTDTNKEYFTGNNLHITYYFNTSTNKMCIDVKEVNKRCVFTYIYPILTEY